MSASVIYVRSLPAARVRVTHVIRVGSSHGTWRTATGPGLLRYPTAHLSPVPGSDRAIPTRPDDLFGNLRRWTGLHPGETDLNR